MFTIAHKFLNNVYKHLYYFKMSGIFGMNLSQSALDDANDDEQSFDHQSFDRQSDFSDVSQGHL